MDPTSLACVSVAPVLCTAPHSIPPPPPPTCTGLSRRPHSILPVSVSVAGFVVVGVLFCLLPFWVRCSSLSCLVLSCFFRVHPWRAFSGACRSRPTLYRAEHHTPMGRVLRSYALEPSRGLCGSDTCMPVLDHIKFQYVPISLLSPFSLNMPQNPSNTTPIE